MVCLVSCLTYQSFMLVIKVFYVGCDWRINIRIPKENYELLNYKLLKVSIFIKQERK